MTRDCTNNHLPFFGLPRPLPERERCLSFSASFLSFEGAIGRGGGVPGDSSSLLPLDEVLLRLDLPEAPFACCCCCVMETVRSTGTWMFSGTSKWTDFWDPPWVVAEVCISIWFGAGLKILFQEGAKCVYESVGLRIIQGKAENAVSSLVFLPKDLSLSRYSLLEYSTTLLLCSGLPRT